MLLLVFLILGSVVEEFVGFLFFVIGMSMLVGSVMVRWVGLKV